MKETKQSVLVSYYGEANCELKLDVKWKNDKTTRNKGILYISLPWSPASLPASSYFPPFVSRQKLIV